LSAGDGSIKAWGESDAGGVNAPADKGYTKIYSNEHAFAALKADGSIKAWAHVVIEPSALRAAKAYSFE
jgi:phosphotransferase system IIA component